MLKLNSKNWMRLRVNRTTKTLTATNEQTYQTKSDCEKDIKSAQYIAINLKALNKLLSDGYSINDTTIETVKENVTESVKQAENVKETKQEFNPEVEEQIRQNYIKAKERKGVEFVKGASIQEKSNIEAEYFAKMAQTKPIRKESEFQKTYDSKWGKYYEKREKEIAKEKASSEVTL